MKKYILPRVIVIDLSAEGVVAASGDNEMNVDLSDENSGDEQFTNKRTIWRNECWLEK